MVGVNERERQRAQHWADLGLPDPVLTVAEEELTRQWMPDYQNPKRALLNPHFEQHPDEKPRGW